MSEVTTAQIVERYVEGLKKAASRARELHSLTGNKLWLNIAASLDQMRIDGKKMSTQKALSELELEMLLKVRQSAMQSGQVH